MKTHISSFIAAFVLTLFLAVNPVEAVEFHVTTSSELQAALSTAASNGGTDTIFLAAGTYYGNFKYTADEAYALTIKPEDGTTPGSIILDGQQTGYVLLMDGNGLAVNFAFEGLTIQNGNSMENGGGIYAKQSGRVGTITVMECNVKDNNALEKGGGAYFGEFESVTIFDSIIVKNNSSWNGGGVYCMTEGTFTSNKISNNFADQQGGGLFCREEGTLIMNSISNNSTYNGGGVFLNGYTILNNNTITDNSATNGGGVYCLGGGKITNNTISNNTGSSKGGGVIATQNMTFAGNTINNNVSNINGLGGGVYCFQCCGTFTNNTIAFNYGHGIYGEPQSDESVQIYNNLIWGNETSGDGSDVYMAGYGAEMNFYNNIYTSAFALWDNEGGNMTVDPLFHDPVSNDFHVAAASPAINAGLNTAPDLPSTDLEGNPRIIDSIVDIGAYERSTAEFHPADLNEDFIIEELEFIAYNAAWRDNTTWDNGPNPIPMSYVTRAGYLLQKGGTYTNIGVGKPATWVFGN